MMVLLNRELAEVCGIHAGDGYLRSFRNRKELDITGNMEERQYYDQHVIPLFNRVFGLKLVGKAYSKGTYGFISSSKEVANTLNLLGFPYGKKSKIVKVPISILESKDKSLYAGFLRGLFDTDGNLGFRKCYGKYTLFKTTRHHYPHITLTTISSHLAKDVSFMLSELKISHFVHVHTPKRLNESDSFQVIINGVERVERWMSLIGVKNFSKLSRYLIWKKFGFCPTNLTLMQREDILNGKIDIYSIGS